MDFIKKWAALANKSLPVKMKIKKWEKIYELNWIKWVYAISKIYYMYSYNN